jgi:4-amino-4-deoxy-L-arabinose transferase-like glycosyltransferase
VSRAAWAAAAGAVAAAVGLLFGRVPLGYDSYFALVWGRALAHGHAPDLDPVFASTPHPLFNALTTVLTWLPGATDDLLRGAVLLALGALCAATFALGRDLAGWPAGLLAAAVVATRAPMLETAVRGEVDIPAAALLMWATVLAARPGRRDARVLALLALAGLLRPEAWVLAAAYWLWRARSWDGRRRVGLTALALAGPAIWLASDLVTAGDALWSSHQTHRRVRASGDATGLDALRRIPRHVGSILWVPALAAAVAGLVAAAARGRERIAVPVAALVLAVCTSALLALAGQTLLLRFFLFPAAILAVLAAYAALGWAALAPGDPARGPWRLGGVALLAALAAFVPKDVARVGDLRDRFRGDEQLQARLVALTGGRARAALHSCRPVYVQLGGVVPTLAFEADLDPDTISVDLSAPARTGALVALAAGAHGARLPYRLPAPVQRPPGYRPVAANESWAISAGCG